MSCTSESKSTESGDEASTETIKNVDQDASGGNTCLLAYQEKYDQLIEEADVLLVTGFSREVMTAKSNVVLKNPAHHSFEYRFKNGRIGKVIGLDLETELPDKVIVSSITPMSLKSFKDSYRVITEDEIAKAKDALDDIADGKSNNPDAQAAVQKAKEHNVSSESLKKVGGGIMNVMKEVSKANTDVSGLGDAAVWNTVTNDLYLLQNGVKVEITANVSNDTERNRAVAIELAEKILAKCD